MAYKNFKQPEIIDISENLRLKAYKDEYEIALSWYRDKEVYYNSEGITDISKIPDENYVKRMYDYLKVNGELYFIEIKEDHKFIPIGDVTLKEENLPIVIGASQYRGIGIGKKVMQTIINRAKELGIKQIYGQKVYSYNIPSQKLHESLGFKYVKTEGNTIIYNLILN